MSVVLEIIGGPSSGQRAGVEPGAVLRVGRSSDNDLVVPDDPTLSRWHFELHHDGTHWQVRDVNSRSGTYLNGQKIGGNERITHLDELKAGLSRFRVQFLSAPASARSDVSPPNSWDLDLAGHEPAEAASPAERSEGDRRPGRFPVRKEPVEMLLSRAKLPVESARRIAGLTSADEMAASLLDAGRAGDAVRLVASAMPPRNGVRWACRCTRQQGGLSDQDEQAVAAAERWVAEPTEANCREAQRIAEQLDYGSAAAWTAMAAFWSGGSLTPADAPPVAPPDDLLPQAIVGALSLAVAPDASHATDSQLAICLEPVLLDDLDD